MATYSRLLLSGSTDGDPIKVAATATPGTAIHTGVSGSVSFDEVYLWVTNTDSVARTITIEWGGVTDPDHLVAKAVSIPANSPPIPLVAGLTINNGGLVKAFGSAANVLLITGHVNQIA
jgi:hypothetical protein